MSEPVNPLRSTAKEWLDFHAATQAESSPLTYWWAVRSLIRWLEARELTEPKQITEEHITKFMADRLAAGLSTGRVRNVLKISRRWLDYCERKGTIPRHGNPIVFRFLPHLARNVPHREYFTYEEYLRIREEAESTLVRARIPYHKYWYPDWGTAVRLGWHTGLRFSDVVTMTWPSVDLDNEVIRVLPMKTKRRREVLQIPMEEELYDWMKFVWDQRNLLDRTQFVCPQLGSRYLRYARAQIVDKFRDICDHCGLFNHSFHSLRHGFVSKLINAGVDPITISSMTGQSIEQIKEYCHISKDAKRNALAKARKALHTVELHTMDMRPEEVTEAKVSMMI